MARLNRCGPAVRTKDQDMSTRRFTLACTLAALLAAGGSPALAQDNSARDRADALNTEGKTLYRDGNLEDAVRKFRQAVVLSPEGRFYFNLCFVLDKQGKYRDALLACEAVNSDNAEDRLVDKARNFAEDVRDRLEASRRQPDPEPKPTDPEPTDPEPTDPEPTDPYPTDPEPTDPEPDPVPGGPTPPEPTEAGYQPGTAPGGQGPQGSPFEAGDIEAARGRRGDYAWSLGAGFGAVFGNFGRDPSISRADRAFARAGQAVRLHSDFLLSRRNRIGVRGYLHISTFDGDLPLADAVLEERLQVYDVGAALYQHRRLAPNIYTTYRGGAHIAVQTVGISEDALTTVGFNAEADLNLVWGQKGQHVLTLSPASFSFYLPASDGTATISAERFGLDSAAFTWTASVGYTFRFSRAFGGLRVFGLE